MSAFPSGVAVVTALDAQSRPRGMTCTSLSSVTVRPPTLLVCLNTASGTLAALLERGRFAVNLLHVRGRATAEVLSAPVPDRFARVDWRPSPVLGAPWLATDAFAVAECELGDTRLVGDHMVVFGVVVNIVRTEDTPLLYGMRRFAAWHAEPGTPSNGPAR
jgi:flavin reductase (DIM6/NTAB) family NADH-FMN oxidoreductase RutF